ncbi:MAG: hypothetical protein WCF23_18420 [Candidatus Nitrosopolaris sp.]
MQGQYLTEEDKRAIAQLARKRKEVTTLKTLSEGKQEYQEEQFNRYVDYSRIIIVI